MDLTLTQLDKKSSGHYTSFLIFASLGPFNVSSARANIICSPAVHFPPSLQRILKVDKVISSTRCLSIMVTCLN